MEQKVGVTMTVKRGPLSWAYIYTALGFALTIEAGVMSMIPYPGLPWNVVLFVLIAAITIWLFIDNKWVHQKLISLKLRYEERGR
jgi:hypothetical protein